MLKDILNEKKISQRALAKEVGVSERAISKLVTEGILKANYETLLKICNYLKCLPMDLDPTLLDYSNIYLEQKEMINYSLSELPLFDENEEKYLKKIVLDDPYSKELNPKKYLTMQVITNEDIAKDYKLDFTSIVEKVKSLTAHQAYSLICKVRNYYMR